MLPDDIRSVYASGECEIDLARRELRVRGSTVPLGARAFEIMEVLAQSAGELVTKDEVMNRIWPGAVVMENTLQVHAMAVRKALGPHRDLLKTQSGRGYRLLGEWTVRRHDAAKPPVGVQRMRVDGESPLTNFPVPVTRLIGRSAAVARLRDLMSAYRLVTLAGPGGIGKTSLALKVARGVVGEFADDGWLVELASLSDPALVPAVAAKALKFPIGPGNITQEAVARAVGDKKLLLVLDNCEHLIGAAATLAEALLTHCPHITILATSRETLRIAGEHVYRVPPLEVPAAGLDDADHILSHGAVELFIARTQALHSDLSPRADELPGIGAICRHLDGIPLAIEFAAARAAMLGVQHVAAGLDDRFALLTSERRTALPRHQTLRATLDWSYELLPDTERLLLRRLAAFSGGFVFDAACAVMHDRPPAEVEDSIGNLVEKSVVNLEHSPPTGRWRLLETVRAYALDKLTISAELQSIKRRHAEFYRDFFTTFDPNANPESRGDELPRYTSEVDNLRAALAWAFSTSGDTALGTALAAAAVNFWLSASLLDECRHWTSKALSDPDGTGHDEQEMVLRVGLGWSSMFTQGMASVTHTSLSRALSIAEARGNTEYQKQAVHGLWWFSLRTMELRKALELGRRYAELARSDTDLAAAHTGNLTIGISLTYLGEYGEATSVLELVIRDYPVARRQRGVAWLSIDPPAVALCHLWVCLFSRGLIDAGIRAAERSIEEVQQVGQPFAVCLALAQPAGLLLPEVGAFDTAERHIAAMWELADRHGLDSFRAYAVCAKGRVLFMRGDPDAGAAALRSGLAQMEEAGYRLVQPIFRGYLAEALTAAGNADEGLVEAEAALRDAEQMDYMRFVPELLRIHGSVIARRQPEDPAAEQMFRRAIDLARRQQALYWELRAALSLAELWQTQGRLAEAHALLAPIFQRFTEGLATPVLVRADALLRATAGCI